ncbi:AAA family ATPase [Actinomadura viridis]|uniref:AAA family ATPase n=1 Tax=Actinomadura viridis TaxID=58110 RepID=UPI003686431D
MYVAKLEVSGVRAFSGPRAVKLEFPRTRPDSCAGWIVLAGRNGSGKSALLQLIALALAGPQNGAVIESPEAWLTDTEIGSPEISSPHARVELIRSPPYDPLDSHGAEWALIAWGVEDGEVAVGVALDGHWSSSFDPNAKGPWSTRPEGWLYLGYGPFRRHSRPEVGLRDQDVPRRSAGFRTLFDEDATLVEGVSWLIGQHVLRLERKPGAQELLDVVLALLGDGLLPDGFRICRVDSEGLWVSRRDGEELPLRRMSDGYRTIGALVVDIIRRMHITYGRLEVEERDGVPTLPYPGVILIDEVDAHLHVSWQKKIGEWLKAHFPEVQFIVSTHSPYICQSADPGGLIRLPGPDEQEPPRVVDEDLYRRVVYGSGDDAVLSDLFGLETPYSDEAERLRERLGELEGKMIDEEASEDEVTEYRSLNEQLRSSLGARVREVSARLGIDP